MITGKQTPFLTRKNEEQLRIMFKDIQTPFQKNCPDGRKNFYHTIMFYINFVNFLN